MDTYASQLDHLMLFAQSLGIGFLVGLERERNKDTIAGVRTFILIALAGSVSGYINAHNQGMEIVLTILAGVIGTLLVAQYRSRSTDPNTTTVLAGILVFGLGFILWLGHQALAASLAVTITALLYFQQELRDVPHRLTRKDITSFFQFAAVAIVLLPVLPDTTYGPYSVFNPYQTGWLVVLISGISLTGYIILRLLGEKTGFLVIGLLGGLISTTVTTLIYARYSKANNNFTDLASTVILLAHSVLFVRLAIIIAVVARSMLLSLLPWLIGGLLAGIMYAAWHYRQLAMDDKPLPQIEIRNPAELKTSFTFAISFSVILILTAWMNDISSGTGVLVFSFISGLTDIDAITISNLKLVDAGTISSSLAVNAIVLAFIANLIFKLGIVSVAGAKKLRIPITLGFGFLAAGSLAGLMVGSLAF